MKIRILTLLLIGYLASPAFAERNFVNSAKQKLDQIQDKIAHNRSKITESRKKEKLLLRDLVVLNRDLTYTGVQLKKAQQNLSFYQGKATQTRRELQDLQQEYQKKRDLFTNRLVQIYKNKNLGFMEFLLSPTNYTSAFDSSYYFERIIKKDMNLVSDLRTESQKLMQRANQLTYQTQKISSFQSEINERKDRLASQQQQKTSYIGSIRSQIQRYERDNNSLMRSSMEIARLIQQRPHQNATIGTGRFIHPTGGWVSSPFGYRRHPILRRLNFHNGTDFAARAGATIKAADSGTVIFAGRWGGYGNATIIDHGRNLTTVYAHQSRIVVTRGQRVLKGQLIGYVGSTGLSTGPHLHFEVRVNGQPVNPMAYLR